MKRLKYDIYNEDKVELDINGVKYRLSFYNDNDSEDPRSWDPLAKMICFSSSYSLGDKHSHASISNVLHDLCEEYGLDVNTIMDFKDDENTLKQRDKRIMQDLKDYVCVKFLYLYDHGDITMSLEDFRDPWDSGIVGIIYMDKETTLKNFPNADEDTWYVIAEEHIQDEVHEYDQWLTGDIYGYLLEKVTTCVCCGKESIETVDSMGGFYGNDILSNGMLEYLPKEFEKYFSEV